MAEDTSPSEGTSGLSLELTALRVLIDEFEQLPQEAHARVLRYLWDRYIDNPRPLKGATGNERK